MTLVKTVLILALVGLAQAQSAPQGTATASVEGVVVKLGTNEPIANIDLELSRIEGTAQAPENLSATDLFSSILFSPGLSMCTRQRHTTASIFPWERASRVRIICAAW